MINHGSNYQITHYFGSVFLDPVHCKIYMREYWLLYGYMVTPSQGLATFIQTQFLCAYVCMYCMPATGFLLVYIVRALLHKLQQQQHSNKIYQLIHNWDPEILLPLNKHYTKGFIFYFSKSKQMRTKDTRLICICVLMSCPVSGLWWPFIEAG